MQISLKKPLFSVTSLLIPLIALPLSHYFYYKNINEEEWHGLEDIVFIGILLGFFMLGALLSIVAIMRQEYLKNCAVITNIIVLFLFLTFLMFRANIATAHILY